MYQPLIRKTPMRHDRWMTLASKLTRHSDVDHAIGSVLVRGGNVLATGFNKRRNDTQSCSTLEEAHIHAEMDALSACDNPKGATIYVARSLSNGEYGASLPCWRCAFHLQEAGVKQVVYINDDGKIKILRFRGTVPDYKSAYAKANEKFKHANHFPFRNVAYSWIDTVIT